MTAFQRDLVRLAPVLRAYAVIMTRSSAADPDDLTQETLEKAWRARAQFEPGTSMKAWLFTILRNSQHNQWRKNRREAAEAREGQSDDAHGQTAQGWRVEFAEVLDAVDRLDVESRQALLLITAGLSYEEAAVVCGSPLRTVQSRVRRARQRLVDDLNYDGEVRTPAPRPAGGEGR